MRGWHGGYLACRLGMWILLMLFATLSNAEVYNPENGHWYQLSSTMDWHAAKAHCEANGAYLATITSQSENTFVHDHFASKNAIWLGANDEAANGDWRWVTGESFTFSNWFSGLNANSGDGANYLMMGTVPDGVLPGGAYFRFGSNWISDRDASGVIYGVPAVYALCERAQSASNDPITTLITHYYQSILNRAPEAEGLAAWYGNVVARQAQGEDVKSVFREMADLFFNSQEYLGRNASDSQFLTNLYFTFFQRAPDEDGFNAWMGQLSVNVPRNEVMNRFLYSEEFTYFMGQVLGLNADPRFQFIVDESSEVPFIAIDEDGNALALRKIKDQIVDAIYQASDGAKMIMEYDGSGRVRYLITEEYLFEFNYSLNSYSLGVIDKSGNHEIFDLESSASLGLSLDMISAGNFYDGDASINDIAKSLREFLAAFDDVSSIANLAYWAPDFFIKKSFDAFRETDLSEAILFASQNSALTTTHKEDIHFFVNAGICALGVGTGVGALPAAASCVSAGTAFFIRLLEWSDRKKKEWTDSEKFVEMENALYITGCLQDTDSILNQATKNCDFKNGIGRKSRSCSDQGEWGNWGECILNVCYKGFMKTSEGQECIPAECIDHGATEPRSCAIAHGSGQITMLCGYDGRWKVYDGSACEAITCDMGYVPSYVGLNGAIRTICVPDDDAKCQPGQTESVSCGSVANGIKNKVRICGTDGTWNLYGNCELTCNSGYAKEGDQCVEAEDNRPDLVVTSVTSPTAGTIGKSIHFSATIKNQGGASAGNFWIGSYFSKDSTITTEDQSGLSACEVSSLAAGETYTCSRDLLVRDSVTPGTYYLGVYADDRKERGESNEGNNGRAAGNQIVILAKESLPICANPVLQLEDSVNVSWTSTQVTMKADKITNRTSGNCISESLALALRAHIEADGSRFYLMAAASLGQLESGYQWTDVSRTANKESVPDGCYPASLNLVKDANRNYRYDQVVLSKKIQVASGAWKTGAASK